MVQPEDRRSRFGGSPMNVRSLSRAVVAYGLALASWSGCQGANPLDPGGQSLALVGLGQTCALGQSECERPYVCVSPCPDHADEPACSADATDQCSWVSQMFDRGPRSFCTSRVGVCTDVPSPPPLCPFVDEASCRQASECEWITTTCQNHSGSFGCSFCTQRPRSGSGGAGGTGGTGGSGGR